MMGTAACHKGLRSKSKKTAECMDQSAPLLSTNHRKGNGDASVVNTRGETGEDIGRKRKTERQSLAQSVPEGDAEDNRDNIRQETKQKRKRTRKNTALADMPT